MDVPARAGRHFFFILPHANLGPALFDNQNLPCQRFDSQKLGKKMSCLDAKSFVKWIL
jgi:hypothetical protein